MLELYSIKLPIPHLIPWQFLYLSPENKRDPKLSIEFLIAWAEISIFM